MATIQVNRKQNLTDICLQVYGTTQLLFKLAKDNDLEIDSDINTGDVLTFDDSLGDLLIKDRIQREDILMINPPSPDIQVTEGIGAWIIESTFVVS